MVTTYIVWFLPHNARQVREQLQLAAPPPVAKVWNHKQVILFDFEYELWWKFETTRGWISCWRPALLPRQEDQTTRLVASSPVVGSSWLILWISSMTPFASHYYISSCNRIELEGEWFPLDGTRWLWLRSCWLSVRAVGRTVGAAIGRWSTVGLQIRVSQLFKRVR